MSDRKTTCSPLNVENNRGVANDAMFAYVHEKNEHSASCFEHFAFFFFIIVTRIHNVLYTKNLLSIKWASIEMYNFFCEMQCKHICYTVVLNTDMSRLSSSIDINRISFRC